MRWLMWVFILCCCVRVGWANDVESLSIENRVTKSGKFWDISKLDLSIFSSTSTTRHWQTKRILTYNFDNAKKHFLFWSLEK